jgi:hypothetical protein
MPPNMAVLGACGPSEGLSHQSPSGSEARRPCRVRACSIGRPGRSVKDAIGSADVRLSASQASDATRRGFVAVGTVASELLARWQARLAEWQRVDASVKGSVVAAEVVADLRTLATADAEVSLTLTEAARRSGYSADHLGRLVRAGTIANAGRPNAPRVRLGDLPRKALALPTAGHRGKLQSNRGRIARSIANPAA